MTPSDIARTRLFSQHIAQEDFSTPDKVVRHLVALQAQDYAGALWSIGLRTSHLTRRDIEDAIVKRTIVRTWPMRGTLHFVAAEDLHWMVTLLAPKAIAAAAGRRRQLGLDDVTIEKAREVVTSELSGNHCLTRQQLCDRLDQSGIETTGQRGIHLLHHFSELGLLCFGPHKEKQPTFVLVDEWLPPTAPKEKDEALAELALRYFTGHGPATLKDFIGWGRLTVTDARRGLEIAKENLTTLSAGGIEYWFSSKRGASKGPIVKLLPGFDEFILGYKDRSASLTPEHANRIVPGGNGMFLSTVIIDGVVHGTWKRVQRASHQELTIIPFDAIDPRYHAQIDSEVARYSHFTGLPTTWKFAEQLA